MGFILEKRARGGGRALGFCLGGGQREGLTMGGHKLGRAPESPDSPEGSSRVNQPLGQRRTADSGKSLAGSRRVHFAQFGPAGIGDSSPPATLRRTVDVVQHISNGSHA